MTFASASESASRRRYITLLTYYSIKDGIIITQCLLVIVLAVVQIVMALVEMCKFSKYLKAEDY